MAELLGVVAGGAGLASLAIQLGESTVRIKRLYKSYQEAPRLLKDILGDLETFALALHNLEQERQLYDTADRAIVDRCIRTCDRAVAQVDAAVSKLELRIQKSNVKGRVLTALSQKSVAQFCDELEKAKMSLIFAYQLYARACQKKETIRILEQLDSNTAVLQQIKTYAIKPADTEDRSLALSMAQESRPPGHTNGRAMFEIVKQPQDPTCLTGRRKSSRQRWRLCFSPWFTNQVWEMSVNVAHSGFNFNFRTSNFITYDAPIFAACEAGDIARVQALFQKGEASPFDCACDPAKGYPSETVLAAAARSRSVELCRFLVETYGFPVSPDTSEDPLKVYSFEIWLERDAVEAGEMYRILLKEPDRYENNFLADAKSCSWWNMCPNTLCARTIRDEFLLTFSGLSWDCQINLAFKASRWAQFDMPGVILGLLGYNAVNSRIALAHDEGGIGALHLVARRLSWPNKCAPPTWVDFVKQLLAYGADVHRMNNSGDTPFTYLLRRESWVDTQDMVEQWAHLLQAAGINLLVYGRTESAMWNASHPSGIDSENGFHRVKSWTYGACPSDWTVDIVRMHKIPVFEMVNAPGTWPAHDRPSMGTICWKPEEEDKPDGSWHWSKVREIILCSKPDLQAFPFNNEVLRFMNHELSGTQDDCRAVMRAIQASSRARYRQRSSSQPCKTAFREIYGGRRWLPNGHRCLGDGRFRVSLYPINGRSCAKGMHMESLGGGIVHHHEIRRQMQRFQARYRNVDELRALPYAAYHPMWNREWPTASAAAAS